jgi:hypothetical protein
MPLLKTTPILAYLDRDATLAFYENLGFESNAKWDGYLMFSRDEISILDNSGNIIHFGQDMNP